MADISLGEGIGLQAGVEKDWMRLLMQNRQLAAQYDAQKARQAEADEDELNKLASKINVTKVHRWQQDEANKDVQDTLTRIQDAYRKNPSGFMQYAQKETTALQGRQYDRINRMENWNNAQKAITASNLSGTTNPYTYEFQKA